MLLPFVLCDRAQPGRDFAGAVVPVRRSYSLVEGLLGQFFGEVFVAAKGQKVPEDHIGVFSVDIVHRDHPCTSFLNGPLCDSKALFRFAFTPIYARERCFVTAFLKKVK